MSYMPPQRVLSTSADSSVIDLRTDTVTLPSKAMRQAMCDAVVGDDVFGEDPTTNQLQQHLAELFGKEQGLFFPSGTQANLAAIGAHCDRGDEIILGNQSHIFVYEAGGASSIQGVAFHTVPNLPDGSFSVTAAKGAIREDNIHYPRTGR
jgi:threonine aldolase